MRGPRKFSKNQFRYVLLGMLGIVLGWILWDGLGSSGIPSSEPFSVPNPGDQVSLFKRNENEKKSSRHEPGLLQSSPEPLSNLKEMNLTVDSIRQMMPSRDVLYKEVEENPHSHPVSLIRFASQLSKKLKGALDSDDQAEKWFEVLKKCVLSPGTEFPESVRAVCLSHAKYLANRRPIIEESYLRLFHQVSPDLRLLLP